MSNILGWTPAEYFQSTESESRRMHKCLVNVVSWSDLQSTAVVFSLDPGARVGCLGGEMRSMEDQVQTEPGCLMLFFRRRR